MSSVITICNPQIEDCTAMAEYATKDKAIDIVAVTLFLVFDFVMAFVPLILHYTWLPARIAESALFLNGWGMWLTWAASWVSYVGNLITYAPVLFWAIFAFFPGTFGTGMMDLFLSWNYYSVVVTGVSLSGLVLFLWLLAAIGTGNTQIWAWFGAQIALYGGIYFTYFFMLQNFNDFFAYQTYKVLVIDATPTVAVEEIEEDTTVVEIAGEEETI